MDRALFLAARGRGRTSPNPMVGAVVVSPEGVVEGWGFHEAAGLPHAEVVALERAGTRARGSVLYCTLEPCCHHGRTGPCVSRIVEAGVRRVVAAIEDPNPLVQGRGFAYLREHGVEVVVGPGRLESLELNRVFFTVMRRRRPFVIAKAAASLDGRIAAAAGQRTAITSKAAERHAHILRAEVDALTVGCGTVMADDPLLTPRHVHRARPFTRVVIDRQLHLPPTIRLLTTLSAGPVVILTGAGQADTERAKALRDAGARIEVTGGSFEESLGCLLDMGIQSVLLEGGAQLHASAWDARLIDCFQVYVAPIVLGASGVPLFDGREISLAGMSGCTVTGLGPDTLVQAYPEPLAGLAG